MHGPSQTGDGTNLLDGVAAKRTCSHTSNPPNIPQLEGMGSFKLLTFFGLILLSGWRPPGSVQFPDNATVRWPTCGPEQQS